MTAPQWFARRGEEAGFVSIEVAVAGLRADAPLVIGLHGRGSSADDLAGLAPALDPGWRYLFPQATVRLDFGDGGDYFSWYEPIMSELERRDAATAGLRLSPQIEAARERLGAFLRAAHARLGVPPGRSALLGFSQGAAMTLDSGLRAAPPYAALVAMSGYLPEADDLPMTVAAAPPAPLLIVHGSRDPVVPVGLARRARDVLAAAGLAPDYREFPMAHEVGDASLAAVRDFLRRHLPAD